MRRDGGFRLIDLCIAGLHDVVTELARLGATGITRIQRVILPMALRFLLASFLRLLQMSLQIEGCTV